MTSAARRRIGDGLRGGIKRDGRAERGTVPDQLGQFLPYILAVAGVGISGGVLAAFWAPGVGARSAVQHFAAGAVIAAVASEIVPEVKRTGHPFGILCGFAGFLALFAFELLG